MHQVNLEYLARIVSLQNEDILFPDTCAGTDSHITMVNGLGVLGWTVGTLEAEAVMFGHPLTFQIPKVIGVKLLGKIGQIWNTQSHKNFWFFKQWMYQGIFC